MNNDEYELTRATEAARLQGAALAESLARLSTVCGAIVEGWRSVLPGDEGRLPMPAAWWAAHAEAPLRETLAARIPDVDPQGRPGYYLDLPLTSALGTVKWPVVRVQDPGEAECIGYVIRRRDDFGAHTRHGYLGSTSDRHNALIMVAIRDDRESVRKVSESLVLGTVEVDDEGDPVWPLLRRGERVGLIREVRKLGANPSRYYTAYVRGRGRSGPFATLDEAEFAVATNKGTGG